MTTLGERQVASIDIEHSKAWWQEVNFAFRRKSGSRQVFFKMLDNCISYIVAMYIVKVVLHHEMIKVQE